MEWRRVVGWEADYEVSNTGTIRRITPGPGTRPGRELKWALDRKGYPYVSLPGKRCARVHQVVANAFIGHEDGLQIRHLDGNPLNPTVENLRWGTAQENADDRVRHGRATGWKTGRDSCLAGHPYTPENTRIRTRSDRDRTYRSCRTCSRATRARYLAAV